MSPIDHNRYFQSFFSSTFWQPSKFLLIITTLNIMVCGLCFWDRHFRSSNWYWFCFLLKITDGSVCVSLQLPEEMIKAVPTTDDDDEWDEICDRKPISQWVFCYISYIGYITYIIGVRISHILSGSVKDCTDISKSRHLISLYQEAISSPGRSKSVFKIYKPIFSSYQSVFQKTQESASKEQWIGKASRSTCSSPNF